METEEYELSFIHQSIHPLCKNYETYTATTGISRRRNFIKGIPNGLFRVGSVVM